MPWAVSWFGSAGSRVKISLEIVMMPFHAVALDHWPLYCILMTAHCSMQRHSQHVA